jgi:hypothetical protein
VSGSLTTCTKPCLVVPKSCAARQGRPLYSHPLDSHGAGAGRAGGSGATKQTSPPTIPVADLFPSGIFPVGEIQEYRDEYVVIIMSWIDVGCLVLCFPLVTRLAAYWEWPCRFLFLAIT